MPTRPTYFKPTHQPARSEDRPSAHQRGYDRQWAKLRRTHLRVNPICVFCGEFATLVDHITPIVVDPSRRLDPSNLRSSCTDCHAKVTANFKVTGVNEMPGQNIRQGDRTSGQAG